MIEPLISLAFSMHSNKGIYAPLLGSGISRAAGIPTGWEVVEDLIRQVAHLYNEECGEAPEGWFKNKFNEEPNYSRLLDSLARSPAERSQILRGYFEANEEDREQGRKIPTIAHHAIAGLVASRHIRVIATTNFDRLIEQALEAVGINPSVIDSPDKIEGAMPLTHAECTVIKLHGDYMDMRIKNTPKELSEYDERMNKMLDRIFDEYGLIVCGWSADYDIALEAAIARCPSRRFTTYWAQKGKMGDAAKRLIDLRRAETIEINGADSFFEELAEKVSALEEFDRPHPMSRQMAVATAKKYLEGGKEIRLYDLVRKETSRLLEAISPVQIPTVNVDKEQFQKLIARYEAETEILLGMISTGCYWSNEYRELWSETIRRIANPPREYTGSYAWEGIRWYPAYLLMYGGGVASVAAQRWDNLVALLKGIEIALLYEGRKLPAALAIYTGSVFENDTEKYLPHFEGEGLLIHKHLYRVLRQPLSDIIPHDDDYLTHFIIFEYFLSLTHADLRTEGQDAEYFWGPRGLFMSEAQARSKSPIMKAVKRHAKEQAKDWAPLKAGLFNGSYERFQQLAKGIEEALSISSVLRE